MPIIAMTREVGSGGQAVAQRLAHELGLKLILHEMVEHNLAEHMHVPEPAVHRRIEGGATLLDRLRIGSKQLVSYLEDEIFNIAREGNVLIRGWGACVLLRGVPHIARVRICAPMDAREKVVMERLGIKDRAAVRREIESNDAAHRRSLRAAYGAEREDSSLYDLVLNTERTSTDACVKAIRGLVESPEFCETEFSQAILKDRALETHIRVKLREWFTIGMGVNGINAKVNGGRVVLSGTAIHKELAADASRIVSAIAGVKDVQNGIVVVHGPGGF